jgi:hypothetical protein
VENVIASDIVEPKIGIKGQFERLDVADLKRFEEVVKDNKITQILHMACILSGLIV